MKRRKCTKREFLQKKLWIQTNLFRTPAQVQTFIKTMLSFELQNVWKDCVVGGFEENYKNWDQKLFNCTFELAPLLVFLLRLSFLYPLTSKLVIYLCLYICLSIYLNFSFYLFDFLLRGMANASNGGWNLLSTRFSVPLLTSVKKKQRLWNWKLSLSTF